MCLFVCLMSELVNSRCKDCSPKSFQCTPCAKLDITVRKRLNLIKKQEREKQQQQQASVRLFTPNQALEDDFVYPPMPHPAPLAIHDQVMYPPPSPLSIASPCMGSSSKGSSVVPINLLTSPSSPPKSAWSRMAKCHSSHSKLRDKARIPHGAERTS